MALLGGKPDIEKLTEKRKIKALRKAFGEKDPQIRGDALIAVAAMVDREAVGLAVGVLVGMVADQRVNKTQRQIKLAETLKVLMPVVDEGLFQEMAVATKDPDEYVRTAAVHAVGKLAEGRKAIRSQVAMYDLGRDVEMLAQVANNLDPEREVDVLLEGLGDRDPSVRYIAAKSLGEGGAKRAIDRLRALAERDPQEEVRQMAKEAAEAITRAT